MPNVNVRVKPNTSSARVVDPTIAMKSNSSLFVDTAICFVRESTGIEQNYNEDSVDDVKFTQTSNYRAYVIGTLFASVAFLEAAINEVFLDAVDCLPKNVREKNDTNIAIADSQVASYRNGELSPTIVKIMAQMWLQQEKYNSWISQNPDFEIHFNKTNPGNNIQGAHWNTLDKYQLALGLNKKRPICKCNPKRRNVQTVIRFRNDLIHFKPVWSVSAPGGGAVTPEAYDVAATKRQVDSLINSDNERPPDGYPNEKDFLASNFPYDCLSAAFANMALQSILQFDDEFSERMGIASARSRFDLPPRLSTIPTR